VSACAKLATLTTVLAMFLVSLAGLPATPPGPGVTGASGRPVVVPGRTTGREVFALLGRPARRLVVAGDAFWVYESRTLADLENLADLGQGLLATRNVSESPARMDEVGMLRFDGATGRLKAVYRH